MNIGHYRKENCVQAHRRDVNNMRMMMMDYEDDGYNKVDGGDKDSENRERGNNNNGKAMGNKYTAYWANIIIIVVAVVCMIPIWVCLYSFSWTGGQDVVSIEEKMPSNDTVASNNIRSSSIYYVSISTSP